MKKGLFITIISLLVLSGFILCFYLVKPTELNLPMSTLFRRIPKGTTYSQINVNCEECYNSIMGRLSTGKHWYYTINAIKDDTIFEDEERNIIITANQINDDNIELHLSRPLYDDRVRKETDTITLTSGEIIELVASVNDGPDAGSEVIFTIKINNIRTK